MIKLILSGIGFVVALVMHMSTKAFVPLVCTRIHETTDRLTQLQLMEHYDSAISYLPDLADSPSNIPVPSPPNTPST